MLSVHRLQRIEHLGQQLHHLGFLKRQFRPFQAFRQAFAVDVVHHIEGGAAFVEEVVYPDDMRIVQFAQALCLLAELLALGVEGPAVFAETDGDLARRMVAAADALDEKFLDDHLLVEGHIVCQIGIAETARSQVGLYAVFAAREQGTLRQQSFMLLLVHMIVTVSFRRMWGYRKRNFYIPFHMMKAKLTLIFHQLLRIHRKSISQGREITCIVP